ncbi:hypothetical protein HMPREF1982_04725 [Clostridiales bacterium oral taxon 876 str. F0540]|nr:hypothetical protein HMPREF1982_04725 [Clostridiales bacterium oral taxon 876 str. F0540]
MKHIWSKKLVKFFHNVRVGFNRLFVVIGIIAVGTALLSVYSIINFINTMQWAYKVNPGAITGSLLALIGIPLISYGIERGLTSYIENK